MHRRICFSLCLMLGVLSEVSFGLVITGQVVDRQVRPIQDAEVVVCERYAMSRSFDDANVIGPSVNTDAQGRFLFEFNPAQGGNLSRQRNIFVVARKRGLASAWGWLNSSDNTLARKDFPLVLETASEFSGQVVDDNGSPVVGAEVQAMPVTTSGFRGINGTWAIPGPRSWFTVTTDAQGRFQFDQLTEEVTASLRVRVPGRENLYEFYQGGLIGFSVGQSDLRLTLPGEGSVTGQVLDDEGHPVSGVDLKVYFGLDFKDMACVYLDRKTRSDDHGFFSVEAVPEGPHWIEVLGQGTEPDLWVGKRILASVKAGQTGKQVIVLVTQGGIYDVTVRHVLTGRPLAGIEVVAYNQEWGARPMVTDVAGRVRIRVVPGSHSISVGADRFSLWQTMATVAKGQTAQLEAALSPIPRMTGIVVDENDHPVANVLVLVRRGDHVVTDSNGRFSAHCDKNTADTDTFIVARDLLQGLAVLEHVTDISVPIRLKLKPAWTLSGRVTDPDGKEVPAARVTLDSLASGGFDLMDVRVLTDAKGRFVMKAIPPEQDGFSYRFTINASGFGPCKYNEINVQGDVSKTINMGTYALNPTTETVTGFVVNGRGVPVKGATLYVNGVDAVKQYANMTATDDQGRFRLTRLCKGTIDISAGYGREPGNQGSIKLQAPAEHVKIVLGKDLYHDGATSLLGKPLPDHAEWSRYLVQGKPVLLCLVDIEQRPSRRCLYDLAQKKKELASRGVTLVVVQVSKTDLAPYAAFLKASHIDTPIRVLEQGFEPAKLAWGVKALPWLILTDDKQVVTGEGLSVEEVVE